MASTDKAKDQNPLMLQKVTSRVRIASTTTHPRTALSIKGDFVIELIAYT